MCVRWPVREGMKTIRQIADEIGVSKQAVYKRYKGKLYTVCAPYAYPYAIHWSGAGAVARGWCELPGQSENPSDPPLEETHEWDKIPMVMVDGKLYYDTGKESTISGRCGVMDGEITSTVDGSEIPTKDNQSNFGTGFEYQYGADNTIEIFMNEKWIVFEQREGAGNQVRYGDRMVDAEGLSKETLEWLDWYNSLPEEQQLAVSFVPSDLIEETGPVKTEDAEVPAQEEELCGYPLAPEEVE